MTTGLSPTPPRPQAAIVIPQDVPVYRVGPGKFFGPNDHLFQEGDIVEWHEEPVVDMEPLNAIATKNLDALFERLDTEGRKVAEKTGKQYRGLADANRQAQELATQEANSRGGLRQLNAKRQVPIMGAKKDTSGIINKIEETAGGLMRPIMVASKEADNFI